MDLNDTDDQLTLNSDDEETLAIPTDANDTLSISQDDVSPSSNQSECDLVIDNDADEEDVYIGDIVHWHVSVFNRGITAAKNVKVMVQLPDGMKYIKHSTTKGTYDPKTGIWDVGNLTEYDAFVFLGIVLKAMTSGEKITSVSITTDSINLNNYTHEAEEIDVFEKPAHHKSITYHKSVDAAMHPTSNPIAVMVICLFAIIVTSFRKLR